MDTIRNRPDADEVFLPQPLPWHLLQLPEGSRTRQHNVDKWLERITRNAAAFAASGS